MKHLLDQVGLLDRIEVDSAGTAAYHVGERADARSRAAASARGVRLDSISRQVTISDFDRFDYLVAMDQDNMDGLLDLARDERDRAKIVLFRSFDPESGAEASVPDPYYGGPGGFDDVFDICQAAARGLLDHIRREQSLS